MWSTTPYNNVTTSFDSNSTTSLNHQWAGLALLLHAPSSPPRLILMLWPLILEKILRTMKMFLKTHQKSLSFHLLAYPREWQVRSLVEQPTKPTKSAIKKANRLARLERKQRQKSKTQPQAHEGITEIKPLETDPPPVSAPVVPAIYTQDIRLESPLQNFDGPS